MRRFRLASLCAALIFQCHAVQADGFAPLDDAERSSIMLLLDAGQESIEQAANMTSVGDELRSLGLKTAEEEETGDLGYFAEVRAHGGLPGIDEVYVQFDESRDVPGAAVFYFVVRPALDAWQVVNDGIAAKYDRLQKIEVDGARQFGLWQLVEECRELSVVRLTDGEAQVADGSVRVTFETNPHC